MSAILDRSRLKPRSAPEQDYAEVVAVARRLRQNEPTTRFPRRAVRVLAEAEPAEETSRLMAMVVLADPAVARSEAARLSPEARDRLEALLGDDTSAAVPADLPEVLAAPPWRDKQRKRVKPVVIADLTPPSEAAVAWLPGEREAWLTAHGAGWAPEQGWESVLPTILDGTSDAHLATYFAAYAPEELVRPQLAGWQPVFSDYEILQPFDQLGRPPLALSAEDRAGKRLVRTYICPDAAIGTHTVGEFRFGPSRFEWLVSLGWQRGPIGDGRLWSRLLRPVGDDGHCVIVELEPGLEAAADALSSYQAFTAVWLSATGDDADFDKHALPFSVLDPVSASVILRDLEEGR